MGCSLHSIYKACVGFFWVLPLRLAVRVLASERDAFCWSTCMKRWWTPGSVDGVVHYTDVDSYFKSSLRFAHGNVETAVLFSPLGSRFLRNPLAAST
jgi:hypothetical protein